MDIGVLGGTFDPVHIGHLVVAVDVRHSLQLDRVLLVVANDPWWKPAPVTTTAEHRYELVAAAVEGIDGLEASRIELDRGGRSHTIDVVETLLGAPDTEHERIHLIVGADNCERVSTWHRADELRELVTLVVVNRGAAPPPPDPTGWDVRHVRVPALDVSSTDVRDRLARGAPVDFLVPPKTVHLIREHGLYPGPR